MLTKTEHKIIKLKMQGFLQKEIANKIERSPETVSVHFKNIYSKTGVQNEIELYNWYAENILGLNIRRLVQVVVLLLIISPSIAGMSDTTRCFRASRTVSRANGRRAENDFLTFYLN